MGEGKELGLQQLTMGAAAHKARKKGNRNAKHRAERKTTAQVRKLIASRIAEAGDALDAVSAAVDGVRLPGRNAVVFDTRNDVLFDVRACIEEAKEALGSAERALAKVRR